MGQRFYLMRQLAGASKKSQVKIQEIFSAFRQYLTLRSVSSLNNPQNSEMKFCENIKLTC
jgi:hypothetical protein